MKVTIEFDPATTDPHDLDLLRELLARHEPDITPDTSVLADVLATFRGDEDRLWSSTICERLAANHPDTYAGWTPTDLARRLRHHGARPEMLAIGRVPHAQVRGGFHRNVLEGIE